MQLKSTSTVQEPVSYTVEVDFNYEVGFNYVTR